MGKSRKLNDGLLARVNFPLYTVEMLTSRHVLVAGGGGSSKTGVANGFVSAGFFHFAALKWANLCIKVTLIIAITLF